MCPRMARCAVDRLALSAQAAKEEEWVERGFLQEVIMADRSTALRRLLAEQAFIHMPVAYDALGGRLIEQTGFKAVYVGGFVTGGSRCTSEPLLTLDEQVRVAGDVAKGRGVPGLAGARGRLGGPLHTKRPRRGVIP